MTFRILKHSTTTDATDLMDNYYHIGQGSRLPLGGDSLAETTGAYDLGSATYKWNKLYSGSIATSAIDSNGLTWDFIARSSIDTPATRIDISGINSDTDNEYFINYFVITQTSTSESMRIFVNQNSTASFSIQSIQIDDTAIARTQSSILFTNNAPTTTALYTNGYVRLNVSSGYDKTLHYFSMTGAGENRVERVFFGAGYCFKTSIDTITSIQFTTVNNMLTGSYFALWRKSK